MMCFLRQLYHWWDNFIHRLMVLGGLLRESEEEHDDNSGPRMRFDGAAGWVLDDGRII